VPGKRMNNKPERRAFNRFPIEFVMEVSAEDSEGNKFNEKTMLKNISGGGAKFITQQAGKYFPCQSLEIIIYLPDTDEVKACMRGTATVLRIDPSSNKDIGEKSQGVGIGVRFDTSLRFERVDVKRQWNSE
jgi:hypothetical protein